MDGSFEKKNKKNITIIVDLLAPSAFRLQKVGTEGQYPDTTALRRNDTGAFPDVCSNSQGNRAIFV